MKKTLLIFFVLGMVRVLFSCQRDKPTGEAEKVALTFTQVTEGDKAGLWTAMVCLLGTNGSMQKLTGTTLLNEGAGIAFESDLRDDLSTFNNQKKVSLVLNSQLVITPDPIGFTCIITGWNPVTGGNVTAQ